MSEYVDITPTPRVLRVLGELPFQPWQCFAELIDNSVDAFTTCSNLDYKRIDIFWSSERVPQDERTIEIKDNACGMTLDQITNAVKAGYSSNTPVDNLGLFGLGFNIATAKLGEKTVVYSTREGDSRWIGVEIDFSKLAQNRTFNAPVVYLDKEDLSEHGTRIIISSLNSGVYPSVKSRESAIKKQLENVYSQLLTKWSIEVYVQNKRLTPKKHCVWSKSRYVIRGNTRVYAVQEIDRIIGISYFDMDRNTYLTPDQEDEILLHKAQGKVIPKNIIERQKRIRGWVGIQRFFDTNEFGIDFIRNGRKILISNKEVFSFENEYTGTSILQYPVELGTTVGGRIVGEVEVDYLIPTYQKNDFDRTDVSWKQTIEVLKGVGPILPRLRKGMGYTDENTSPIGLLANAYRRTEKGTKNLALERSVAAEFYKKFLKGDPDFVQDDRWWQAVVEADREQGTKDVAGDVDSGDVPSDDPAQYIGNDVSDDSSVETLQNDNSNGNIMVETSTLDSLLTRSSEHVSLSRGYSYDGRPPFNVKVHKMKPGECIYDRGTIVPCKFFSEGIECDFFYDEKHELLSQYPNSPESLLLINLAKKFSARDGMDLLAMYARLTTENFKELKIDKASLKEQAISLFDELREMLIEKLGIKYDQVVDCVKESSGETEETMSAMLSDTELCQAFKFKTSEAIGIISYVPNKTLIRLVDKFPTDIFDGKIFNALYAQIELPDSNAVHRLREESKERIIALLKDVQAILNDQNYRLTKNELVRYGLSLDILKGAMV